MASIGIHSVAFQSSIRVSRSLQVVEIINEFGLQPIRIGKFGRPRRRRAEFRPICNLDNSRDGKIGKENVSVQVQKYIRSSLDAVGEFQRASLPTVTYVMQKCVTSSMNAVEEFQGVVSTLPPVTFVSSRYNGRNFTIGFGIAVALLFISLRAIAARKSRNTRPSSVADLVRRGQLRSDRRGISKPLNYDDPFDNPYVKVSKQKSHIEMCGKVYCLEPVTLTNEQRANHQKRRSRAYQWKRPTIFLKEGDQIPPDVDPDTIRWIPANHPFATTTTDIDEDMAQTNVYQKHGVPFRIQAEHEALQKKLETLQHDQKLDKLVIDASAAMDFERPYKSRAHEPADQSQPPNSTASNYESEDAKKQ